MSDPQSDGCSAESLTTRELFAELAARTGARSLEIKFDQPASMGDAGSAPQEKAGLGGDGLSAAGTASDHSQKTPKPRSTAIEIKGLKGEPRKTRR